MSTANQELGKRWFDEIWNKQHEEVAGEILHPDAVLHEGGTDFSGLEAFHAYFERMQASFSEFHVTVHDAIGEGDTVCLRWSATMTHSGPGLGIPPTGRTVETTGITIMRFDGGKLVEGWQNWDMVAVLEAVEMRGKGTNALAVGG